MTSLSVIVKIIVIPSDFDKNANQFHLGIRSMMCNTLNLVIELILASCFKVN